MKYPLWDETPLRFQSREQQVELYHHIHLEGNEWPLHSPGIQQ